MAETINYAPLIPKEHPENLAGWAMERGSLKKEYLIYKAGWEYDPLEDRNKPVVSVVCSECGRGFTADKINAGGCGCNCPPAPFGWWNEVTGEAVISGSNTLCPICGAETVHVGKIPRGISQYTYVTTVTKLPVEGERDRLLLTEWEISREINKSGESRFYYHIWSAWVVDEKKIIRLKGWTRCISALCRHPLEQRKTFMDDYGKAWLIYPWEPSVLEGTTAENSKLDRYIDAGGEYLVAYLALWRKRPAVENLVMQGYGSLVNDLIDRDQYHSSYSRNKGIPTLKEVNWKEKKPNRMLGLTKEEFRACAGRMTKDGFLLFREARERGAEIRIPEDLTALERAGKYAIGEILDTAPSLFRRVLKYIGARQGRTWILLRDYWRMSSALKMDLDNDQVRWPKELKDAHDKVMVRYRARKSEMVNQGILDHAAKLEQFAYHADGILIRPCATHEELIQEGKQLRHCVATYADRYADGRTAILLIREEANPDKPWFTLELDEEKLTVRQNRGKGNCARTPEVQAFEEKWLAWIRSGCKQRKPKKATTNQKKKKKAAAAA